MRSSGDVYLIGLDHLRALAAFMVVSWHFMHRFGLGTDSVPAFAPLSLLEEGHTGISLFMVITGFVFTYLCYGRELSYPRFLKNRFLRLFPLIFLFFIIRRALGDGSNEGLLYILFMQGNGSSFGIWSLAVECQFYLFFPIFVLYAASRFQGGWRKYLPFALLVLLGFLLRLVVYYSGVPIREAAYFTMLGRIDQLMLGCMACLLLWDMRQRFAHKRQRRIDTLLLLAGMALAVASSHLFNQRGGFDHHPAELAWHWNYQMTLEGLAYALLLAGWVGLAQGMKGRLSRAAAYLGEISYSTYLVHFALLMPVAGLIGRWQLQFSGDAFANAFFYLLLVMYPITLLFSALLYELIEKPFLRLRTRYIS